MRRRELNTFRRRAPDTFCISTLFSLFYVPFCIVFVILHLVCFGILVYLQYSYSIATVFLHYFVFLVFFIVFVILHFLVV